MGGKSDERSGSCFSDVWTLITGNEEAEEVRGHRDKWGHRFSLFSSKTKRKYLMYNDLKKVLMVRNERLRSSGIHCLFNKL